MNENNISNDQLAKSLAKAISYIGVYSQEKNNQPSKQLNKQKTTNYNLNIPNDEHNSPQNPHTLGFYSKHNKQKQSLSVFSSLETEDLEIKELTKKVAEAKILEKKAKLK